MVFCGPYSLMMMSLEWSLLSRAIRSQQLLEVSQIQADTKQRAGASGSKQGEKAVQIEEKNLDCETS